KNRNCRLQAIEDPRQRREPLAPGPEDVGCPDAPGPDLADVALTAQPGQHEPEGDRPKQIAERQGEEHLAGHGRGGSKPEQPRNLRARLRRPTELAWAQTHRSSS